MSDEPMSVYDLRVIVSPETEDGERTVVVREGTQTNREGPMVIGRDDRAEATIDIQSVQKSDDRLGVKPSTDLFAEQVATDGGTSSWASIPEDLPDDFDDRDFSEALFWLSNQPKKKEVRVAALEEAGVDDPYVRPTKAVWARLLLELRRRRLAIERLQESAQDPDPFGVYSDEIGAVVSDLGIDRSGLEAIDP